MRCHGSMKANNFDSTISWWIYFMVWTLPKKGKTVIIISLNRTRMNIKGTYWTFVHYLRQCKVYGLKLCRNYFRFLHLIFTKRFSFACKRFCCCNMCVLARNFLRWIHIARTIKATVLFPLCVDRAFLLWSQHWLMFCPLPLKLH